MPIVDDSGHLRDSVTGLWIPKSYSRPVRSSVDYLPAPDGALLSAGVILDRDSETLALRWADKGSGLDDVACEAIADGRVANVGIAPVISPQVIAAIRRQQDQAATATFELSGKKSPVKKAKEAIARFNDSPLGIMDAIKLIVRNLRVYNRGAPIATVPITYDVDTWEEMGLNIIPITGYQDKYYLDVDWAKHGTPLPFLPDIYRLQPTGVYEWPYWYNAKMGTGSSWVLLHKTQILPMTPGATSMYGVGTSAMWMILGVLAEEILVSDARIEKLLNAITDGLVIITGMEINSEQIVKKMKESREEAQSMGYLINKGTTILTTSNNDAKYVAINFRQDDSMPAELRKQHFEDVLSSCMSEPLSSIVTRGGIGFGAQADTVAAGGADTGVGAILYQVAGTLGAIYKRVTITVNRPNDLMQRLNIQTLNTFAGAVSQLPPGTLTTPEIRAMIDTMILPIPVVEEDFSTTSTSPSEDEDAVSDESEDPQEGDPEDVYDDKLAVQLARSITLATLFEEDEIVITDEDVNLAIDQADEIDPELGELLIAEEAEE